MIRFTPLASPYGLTGLGATAAEITDLQKSLIDLAKASGRPNIHPGTVNGILTDSTMLAVAAGLQAAAQKIPKNTVASTISIALALGATSAQAKTAVSASAAQLTLIIRGATAAYATGLIKPGMSQAEIEAAAAAAAATAAAEAERAKAVAQAQAEAAYAARPWYTKWWGVGALVVGAYAAYLMRSTPKAAK